VSEGLGLGLGSAGFVERHGLYSDDQAQATVDVAARIEELGLRTVRLILVDQHGVARSKHLSGEGAIAAMRSGADFSGAVFSLDTGNRVFPPAFVQGGGFGIDEFTGFPDVVVVPDPATFQLLPWADRTGWMICDVYFANGRPVPLDGRAQLRAQLARLREAGYGYMAGSRSSSTSRGSRVQGSGSTRSARTSPVRRPRSRSSSVATSSSPT
jgi:glutamine synthetase